MSISDEESSPESVDTLTGGEEGPSPPDVSPSDPTPPDGAGDVVNPLSVVQQEGGVVEVEEPEEEAEESISASVSKSESEESTEESTENSAEDSKDESGSGSGEEEEVSKSKGQLVPPGRRPPGRQPPGRRPLGDLPVVAP